MDSPRLPPIRDLAELKSARRGVKVRVDQQEVALQDRLQELPGQLLSTGMRYILPTFLAGRLTDTALDAGKSLVDLFFVRKGEAMPKEEWKKSLKRTGILTVMRVGVRLLTKFI